MKRIDLFGHPIQFNLNNKIFVHSQIGGFFTIMAFLIVFIFAYFIGKDIILKKNPISYVQTDIMGVFPNVEITKNNFPFAFTLTDDDNVPMLDFSILNTKLYYIQYELDYETELYSLKSKTEYNLKFCNFSDFPNTSKDYFLQAQLGYSLCPVDSSFSLEGYWTQDKLYYLQISIEKCTNNKSPNYSNLHLDKEILNLMKKNFEKYNPKMDLDNDNKMNNNENRSDSNINPAKNLTNSFNESLSDVDIKLINISTENLSYEKEIQCKMDDEINYYISKSSLNLNLFYINTKVSISNNTYPSQQVIGSSYKYLLTDGNKKSLFKLQQQFISTDNGYIFSSEEKLNFLKLIEEQTDILPIVNRNSQIMSFEIYSSNISETYNRRYIKIPEIIASLGGIIKLLSILFIYLNKYFCEVDKNISIINEIFVLNKISNKQENKINIKKNIFQFESKVSNNLAQEIKKENYTTNFNKKTNFFNKLNNSKINNFLKEGDKINKKMLDNCKNSNSLQEFYKVDMNLNFNTDIRRLEKSQEDNRIISPYQMKNILKSNIDDEAKYITKNNSKFDHFPNQKEINKENNFINKTEIIGEKRNIFEENLTAQNKFELT